MNGTTSGARLSFRLNRGQKETIEDAAAQIGKTVSEFALTALLRESQRILDEDEATREMARDRQFFAKLLDNMK